MQSDLRTDEVINKDLIERGEFMVTKSQGNILALEMSTNHHYNVQYSECSSVKSTNIEPKDILRDVSAICYLPFLG